MAKRFLTELRNFSQDWTMSFYPPLISETEGL